MSEPASIKIFLARGNPKRLRTAEISNWSGLGVAAPRSELDDLLVRPELNKPGIYILTGHDPESGAPTAYIGEAEVLRSRLRSHRDKDFWVHAYVFVSKDDNLTKGHIRYLEGRVIEEVVAAGRVGLANAQGGGSPLSEADRADMEVFLGRMRQLLPALGTDLLTLAPSKQVAETRSIELYCRIKSLVAKGARTPDGFVVFSGSQAVLHLRPSSEGSGNFAERRRAELLATGALLPDGDSLRFTQDVEFSSPSGAASIVRGGNTNGLRNWVSQEGVPLGDLEAPNMGGKPVDPSN